MARPTKNERLTIILPASEKTKLAGIAKKRDQTTSVILRSLIRDFLKGSKNAKTNP